MTGVAGNGMDCDDTVDEAAVSEACQCGDRAALDRCSHEFSD
jgi:hypothetical protein